MKKLLMVAAAVAALTTPTLADPNIEGLSGCRKVSMLVETCFTASGKPINVIYNDNQVDALDDGKEQLAVMNLLAKLGMGGPNQPRVFKYSYTPQGQLPACDAAEMVKWLAGTRRPLGAVWYPTSTGTVKGKNLCAANVAGHRVNYSIELLDDGRWWAQPVF